MFDTLTRKNYLVLLVFGVRLGDCLRHRELFGSRGRLLTCFLFVLRGLRALLLLLFKLRIILYEWNDGLVLLL